MDENTYRKYGNSIRSLSLPLEFELIREIEHLHEEYYKVHDVNLYERGSPEWIKALENLNQKVNQALRLARIQLGNKYSIFFDPQSLSV